MQNSIKKYKKFVKKTKIGIFLLKSFFISIFICFSSLISSLMFLSGFYDSTIKSLILFLISIILIYLLYGLISFHIIYKNDFNLQYFHKTYQFVFCLSFAFGYFINLFFDKINIYFISGLFLGIVSQIIEFYFKEEYLKIYNYPFEKLIKTLEDIEKNCNILEKNEKQNLKM
jgi:hypothetical protein